ncbi:MAG: hypothetical protein IJ446_09190 [Oscillospiraceae bacterium]|nr:hypothetical protein [Oscillospiraceae bacterium]
MSLYNAVNGSSYTDPEDIKITTIEDAVYMNMKNDVSFLIADTMNFYEQQSTVNPNMPMRFLVYAGMVYDKYIEDDDRYHKYSTRQQKAPAPRCICFYNGVSEQEEKVILKLSDSFDSDGDIEVIVTMLNINYGHNKELLAMCRPLNDYAWFVDRVRIYKKELKNLEKAIDMALSDLSDESLIKSFLLANRAEVKRMCITEYDEERTIAEFREEARAEGFEEGKAEGRAKGIAEGRAKGIAEGIAEGRAVGLVKGALNTLVELVKDGLLSVTDASAKAQMSVSEFEKLLAAE